MTDDRGHPSQALSTYHASRDDLIQALCSRVADLSAALREYSVVWETERRAKSQAIAQAQAQGLKVTETDRFITMATVTHASATIRLTQDIRALEAEIDHLRFLIPLRPE